MTAIVTRPLRGLWRDRHPADVPVGALQRAENVVFRKRGALSPIEAPVGFAKVSGYAEAFGDVSNVLVVNRMHDCTDYALITYQEGNADVGDLAHTDEATIVDGTHYHHGTWRVDGRAIVDGRVVLITEVVDAIDTGAYTVETGDHYHYGRWIVEERVTVDGRVILILDKTAWLWSPGGDRTDVSLPGEPIAYEPGCMNAVRYRDAVYWTSMQGLVCSDHVVPNSDDYQLPDDARRAGLPAPLFDTLSLTATSDNTGGIATAKVFNCVAVFRRDRTDGSFMRSPPSTPVQIGNTSGSTRIITHLVNWTSGIELAAGDLIEIYRTETEDTGTDPGEDYKFTVAYTLTAADITARYATFTDAVADEGLGETLYTSPGEEGALSAYFPPPYLRDVVEYGGALLGIMAREHESITATLSGRWGTLSTAADRTYGWGTRPTSGDVSVGVATITNVSAADMVGIEAGQYIDDALYFPYGAYVASAAGTTIVTTAPAQAAGTGVSISIKDVLKVNDTTLNGGSVYLLLARTDSYTGMEDVAGITMRVSAAVRGSATLDAHASVSWSRHYAYGEERPFTVGATNGQNFHPEIGSLSSPTTSKSFPHENRITWSAGDLPESWPLLNRAFVGIAPLVRQLKVGDAVYCFADDGTVYRISGTVDDYRIDPVFHGHRLLSAPAAASFGDVGYFWSSRGWVRFGDGSMDVISRDRVGRDLRDEGVKLSPTPVDYRRVETPFNWYATCAIDPVNSEAWLRARVVGGDGVTYIYSEADNEITEYTLVHGLGSVAYARVCFGGGIFLSGIDSTDIKCLSARMSGVDAAETLYKPERESGLYEGTFCIELQRVDMGTPDNLKLLNEIVLGLTSERGQADDAEITVTVYGDMDQGDGDADAVTVNVAGAPQRLGRGHVVPVSRKSAGASQYTVRIEADAADHRVRWFLEHIAARFTVASDTTAVIE